MISLRIALVVSGVCLFVFMSPEAHAENGLPTTAANRLSSANPVGVPQGLSASEWSSIRAAYEAKRHEAFAVEGGYQARNPSQQWRTTFDGRGFWVTPDGQRLETGAARDDRESETSMGGWSWGLELVSYGRGDREGNGRECMSALPGQSACVTANGGHVSYEWDDHLTEWYINDQRGLEHGYTLHRRPNGSSALQFTLVVRGDLQPRVSTDWRSVAFVNHAGTAKVNYTGLKVFDANGADVPAWFEHPTSDIPHPTSFRLVIDDSNATYPLTIDPIAQQVYLKASNTGADDRFGFSLAVSGDTVVVGAWREDSSATGVNGNQADNSAADSGAAYVFWRDGSGVWSQQAYLKASNTGANDNFGNSVAVSGDTVVVGAYREDSNATGENGNQADNSAVDAGAAYVFTRTGGVWSQQAYLKASNTRETDQFGHSVAVSGDTLVVGSHFEGTSAPNSGAAYVFVRNNGGVWSQQAFL